MVNMRHAESIVAATFATFAHSIRREPIVNSKAIDFVQQFKVEVIRGFGVEFFFDAIRNHNRDLLRGCDSFVDSGIKISFDGVLAFGLSEFGVALRAVENFQDGAGVLINSDIPKDNFVAAIWANKNVAPHDVVNGLEVAVGVFGLVHPIELGFDFGENFIEVSGEGLDIDRGIVTEAIKVAAGDRSLSTAKRFPQLSESVLPISSNSRV